MDLDVVSKNIVPLGIYFRRHFEGVNQGIQPCGTRFVAPLAVKPYPEHLGVVKGRPIAEDVDKLLCSFDAIKFFHLKTALLKLRANRAPRPPSYTWGHGPAAAYRDSVGNDLRGRAHFGLTGQNQLSEAVPT
jgi:hypothetical protein